MQEQEQKIESKIEPKPAMTGEEQEKFLRDMGYHLDYVFDINMQKLKEYTLSGDELTTLIFSTLSGFILHRCCNLQDSNPKIFARDMYEIFCNNLMSDKLMRPGGLVDAFIAENTKPKERPKAPEPTKIILPGDMPAPKIIQEKDMALAKMAQEKKGMH